MNDKNRIHFVDISESIVRKKITVLTFILSIMVIGIHAFNLDYYHITITSTGFDRFVYLLEKYTNTLYQMATPAFFMVSAYLFYRTFQISKLLDKWKSRVFTVLVPYLIWCTLYYVFFVIATNMPAISSILSNGKAVSLSVITWFNWLWKDSYYTLWFLKNLIVFILLAPVIWLLFNNHFQKVPTGLILSIAVIIVLEKGIISFSWSQGLSYYIIGAYVGLNCRKLSMKSNPIISIVSICYIAMILISGFICWNMVTISLFIIACWFAMDLLPLEGYKTYWWMSLTFFTYVAHDLLLETIQKLIGIFLPHNGIIALIDYLVSPLTTLLILIGIAYMLQRFIPGLWKLISGNRMPVLQVKKTAV